MTHRISTSTMRIAPSITVLVPALNEEGNLKPTVERLIRALDCTVEDYEIIIVNDGSSDGTGAEADALASQYDKVKVIHHDTCRGLGASYAEGVRAGSKHYFTYVPGDNTWPYRSFVELFSNLGKADVITSYSVNPEVRPTGRRIVSRLYTMVLNLLFGRRMRYYNGLTIYPKDYLLLEPISTRGFGFQAEALLKAISLGLSYVEVGLPIDERTAGKSKAVNSRNIASVLGVTGRLFWELRVGKAALAAMAIILATVAILYYYAALRDFLVCDTNCGETVLALQAADQFARHGPLFGLLENLGTPTEPSLYTHNVNMGSLSFIFLEWLGVSTPSEKLLLPFAIYAVGLFYMFLTVEKFSGSSFAALIVLLLFATTYWAVGSFASNALRAWHGVGFFATVYHASQLRRGEWRHAVGVMVAGVIAFGCGYDFWIICGSVALALLIAQRSGVELRPYVIVAVAFALPLLLRQAQILWVMGSTFWWQDIVYSVAIKVPYLTKIISIPPLAEIDAWYRSLHVLRPPAQPTSSVKEIFYTFRHMVAFVTLPRWGILTLLIFIGVLVAGLVPAWRQSMVGRFSASYLLPCTIGSAIGLAVLSPFSLHVYFKHEFPLLAFLILPAKGVAIYAALKAAAGVRWQRPAAAAGIIVLIFVDAVLMHWSNTATGLYPNLGWAKFVAKQTPADVTLAAWRIDEGADALLGFKQSLQDYISPHKVAAATTRYVVYQPVERIYDFDSPYPLCTWRDWISVLFSLRRRTPEGWSCIYGFQLPAGAKPQPSADEAERLLRDYDVIARSDVGVGYIILERRGQ